MKKILALLLTVLMLFTSALALFSCGDEGGRPDALVIMSDELDGLFNPYFSTSGADGTIVSMTQIGMLSSKYVNGAVEVGYGEGEAVVTKDYAEKYDARKDETTYTFVIKNGIKYSDGAPLTMEDVLFNLYVYLDPVYTGSATMYSTDIKGLTAYRTQTPNAGSSNNSDDRINQQATTLANNRIMELASIFNTELKKNTSSGIVTDEQMRAAISTHSLSSGYKDAISTDRSSVTNSNLLEDYEYALKLFREELERDFAAAKDSYTEAPYKGHDEFKNEIICFLYMEGMITVDYANDGKDKSKIERVNVNGLDQRITTKDAAIDYVFRNVTESSFSLILGAYATAQTLFTEYSAQAKEVVLRKNAGEGELTVPNIEGIVSLGHTKKAGSEIEVNGTVYKVASEHNPDGTVKNDGEYDVLQITIDGIDPKAKWNFAFSVAPQHYYGEGSKVGVDIANNKFGVEFGSFDFMKSVIQSTRNIKIPMGAGAYKATDRSNSDTPDQSAFYTDNVVYFKANNYFETVGEELSNAKIEKVRYQVVSATNAISVLEGGTVHYVTPQLTQENYTKLQNLQSEGISSIRTDQLGYGYIGINASKVPDINIRKAIMCAMNTALAVDYYSPGTAEQIYWPMSTVSWAFPKDNDGNPLADNGKEYPQVGVFNVEFAKESILSYMEKANVKGFSGNSKLKIKFTIAGSNLQDHPTYKTFRDAAALLNELGWEVEVVPAAEVCKNRITLCIHTLILETADIPYWITRLERCENREVS